MNQIIAITIGGGLGSLLRFWMSSWVYGRVGRDFPYGTLAVNVLGSLAIGLLYILLVERFSAGPVWRAALMIGLLGGFTTFSSFSLETLNLLESGEWLRAMLNVIVSVVLCLGATWIGMIVGRQL